MVPHGFIAVMMMKCSLYFYPGCKLHPYQISSKSVMPFQREGVPNKLTNFALTNKALVRFYGYTPVPSLKHRLAAEGVLVCGPS